MYTGYVNMDPEDPGYGQFDGKPGKQDTPLASSSPQSENSVEFVPVVPPQHQELGMSTGEAITGIGKAMLGRVAEETMNYATNKFEESATNAIRNSLDGIANVPPHTKGPTYSGGGGGRRSDDENRDISNGVPHDPRILNYNSKPIEIELNTGIVPNTYSRLYLTADNYGSPLQISTVNIAIPTADTNLDTFFTSVLAFDIQNRVQMAVAYSINLTTFSAANIRSALQSLIYALSIYFYYDSIIAYCNNPLNRNEGMLYLRSAITADMIQNIFILKRKLLGTPIPPHLMDLVFYLYGNFKTSEVPGSSLIKFSPLTVDSTGQVRSAGLTTCISDLDNYREVFNIFSKACPHWVAGYDSDLPGNVPIPSYDPNFTTIWANAPFIYYDGVSNSAYGPTTTTNTPILYNSFTNKLDGAAYALTSGRIGSNWIPGLLVPSAYGSTSLISYSRWNYTTISSTTKLHPAGAGTLAQTSRNETYIYDASYNTQGYHRFGAEQCEAVTDLTIRQTAYKLMEWLMSLEGIIPRSDPRTFPGKSSNSSGVKSRPRRRNRKDK